MMPAVDILHTWLQALGWMLVHSLWQCSILALLAALIISLTGQRAAFHYRVLLLAFIAFIIACVCTFVVYAGQATYSGVAAAGVLPGSNIGRAVAQHTFTSLISTYAPLLVCCWFPFCCYRLIKGLGGYLYVHRLCKQDVFGVSEEWNERFARLAQQMGITKTVRLLESAVMKVPVSMGFWKPVVLIPLGMLCALPPEQVEVVLRHELAHIRRNDYLVNLFQLVAEAVFFFNPGLLWLSRQLREKREFCCDDAALIGTHDNQPYLQALIYFSSLSLKAPDAAMGLRGQSGQLYRRITRILAGSTAVKSTPAMVWLYTGIVAVLLFAGVYISTGKQPVRNAKAAMVTEVPVTMDSAMLARLTGEFNTTYNNAHYVIGVAKSRITHLSINGQVIPPQQWQYYNNALAAAVLEFKTHLEKAKPIFPSSNQQPVQGSDLMQVKL